MAMSPTKKCAVNKHVQHTERTANRNCVLPLNVSRAASAHRTMVKTIQGQTEEPGDSEPEDSQPTSSTSPPKPATATLTKQVEDEEENSGDSDDNTNKLTEEEKVMVRIVFKEEIERGRPLTQYEVISKIRKDMNLHKLVVNKPKLKKTTDFVAYRAKLTEIARPADLPPEESASLRTADYLASLVSTGSKAWSAERTSVIEEKFSSF